MVGCCVPDWLSSADRQCRVREKRALEFINHENEFTANIARGVVQHHRDDYWFHQTRAFVEMNMQFAQEVREELAGEAGFRPSLLGHIIIELLLDAYLHKRHPGKLNRYYELVAQVDSAAAQNAINLFATRPTDRLVHYQQRYLEARFLFDYSDDERLLYRINQVFKRVKLNPLGDSILPWIKSARRRVYDSVAELLADYEIEV